MMTTLSRTTAIAHVNQTTSHECFYYSLGWIFRRLAHCVTMAGRRGNKLAAIYQINYSPKHYRRHIISPNITIVCIKNTDGQQTLSLHALSATVLQTFASRLDAPVNGISCHQSMNLLTHQPRNNPSPQPLTYAVLGPYP